MYRERQAKEETLLAAKVKVAIDIEAEQQQSIEYERRHEERQRFLAQRMRELEAKEAANNLRVYFAIIITKCFVHWLKLSINSPC